MTETMSGKRTFEFDWRSDGVGIALFTGGAFLTVLLVLAVGSEEPLTGVGGTGFLARLWAGAIGLLPSLVVCAGLAGLGAHRFLAGGIVDLKRGALRLAVVALGLAVLLGAFSDTAGGFLGAHTSGALARWVHGAVGAALGLVAFLLPIWVLWLRPALEDVTVPPGPREAPARPLSSIAEPEPSLPEDVGVSAAEAAALIPEDLPSWRTRPRMYASTISMAPLAPSPYPEDVRLRGAIPDGAKPFRPEHDAPRRKPAESDEPPVPSVHDWAPEIEERVAAFASRKDLALPEAGSEADPTLEMPETIGQQREPIEADELSLAAGEIRLEEPIPSEAPSDREESTVPPRPSWEQPGMFEEEEPVDAYGTPLSIVQESASNDDAAVETRDVTLRPVAPARKRKPGAKVGAKEHAKLVAEIGCLLVERGRVAVSMLQKQYGMDFEEATKVLDELQELGLIGPYLGGQRRDILLTRDEWLEKVSSL